jgi:hypothetical protein
MGTCLGYGGSCSEGTFRSKQVKIRRLANFTAGFTRQAPYRISGVNLTSIDEIDVETVQVVLSEYSPD